ncbi:hypothetical protein [Parvularcula sp. LCG005]|uniref:hypothetical protein n=1 Tax=Parvularcula sp. LCG005 TaxID=3078805 RepID=UPI002943F229|nr:hypothetical protein [Parvularcula sp. LCG005]WOI53907.1 hypothetical protein RUI03_02630 [Parvularcula sp. LCG005]
MFLSALFLAPALTLSPAPEGAALTATYKLEAPVTEFVLGENDGQQRAGAWLPIGDGWIFDGTTITREDGAGFDEVAFQVSEDIEFHDRKYVVSSIIGEDGWALYLPAFSPSDDEVSVRFEGFPEDTALLLPGNDGDLNAPLMVSEDDNRSLFIGPSTYVFDDVVQVVAGPELPVGIRDILRDKADQIARTLTMRLGDAPDEKPLILVSYRPEGARNNWKGGAFDRGTIKVDIRTDLSGQTETQADHMASFIAHEMTHLWLNGVWDTTENQSQPWLHEGAAEYISRRLTTSGDEFTGLISSNFERCASQLGNNALSDTNIAGQNGTPYDCGFIVQWVAETASLKRRKGDILDLWKDVVTTAPDGEYDSAHFLRVAEDHGGPAFGQFADALIHAGGRLRWVSIGSPLSGLKIEFGPSPAASQEGWRLLALAIKPMMQHYCNGYFSWSWGDEAITIDADDKCGEALSGKLVLASVNGVRLTSAPFDALSTIKKACTDQSEITFTSMTGEDVAVACAFEVEDPTPSYAVTAHPTLPPLNR